MTRASGSSGAGTHASHRKAAESLESEPRAEKLRGDPAVSKGGRGKKGGERATKPEPPDPELERARRKVNRPQDTEAWRKTEWMGFYLLANDGVLGNNVSTPRATPTGFQAYKDRCARLAEESFPGGFSNLSDLWRRLRRWEDGEEEPQLCSEVTFKGTDEVAQLEALFRWAYQADLALPAYRQAWLTMCKAGEAASKGERGLHEAARICRWRRGGKGRGPGVDWERMAFQYLSPAADSDAVDQIAKQTRRKRSTVIAKLQEVRADWRQRYAYLTRCVEAGEELGFLFGTDNYLQGMRHAIAILDTLPDRF